MMMMLEIAICLALIYALGALVCTVIHETIAQVLRLRWKNLHRALTDMLETEDYGKLMSYPLIKDLWDETRKPTAIPSVIVARSIVHAFEPRQQDPSTDAMVLLKSIPPALQQQIVPFIEGELKDLHQLYTAAQTWFDTSMTAASEWYGRQAHAISIVVGIVFAIALNVDTISIGMRLAEDPLLRAATVQVAQQTLKQYQDDPTKVCPDASAGTTPQERLASCIQSLTSIDGDLVGWNDSVRKRIVSRDSWLTIFVGWLVSGLAMSLGARFWFDALSKLISMRAGLSGEEINQAAKDAKGKAAKANQN